MAQVSFSYSKLRDWAPLTTESMVPGKLYMVEWKDSSTGSQWDIVMATTPFKGQAVGDLRVWLWLSGLTTGDSLLQTKAQPIE